MPRSSKENGETMARYTGATLNGDRLTIPVCTQAFRPAQSPRQGKVRWRRPSIRPKRITSITSVNQRAMTVSTTFTTTATILRRVLERCEIGSSKETPLCRANSEGRKFLQTVLLEIHESLIYSRFAISPAVLATGY